jgi:hypothetical protein
LIFYLGKNLNYADFVHFILNLSHNTT